MMNRMTVVQHLINLYGIRDLRLLHNRGDSIPDPDGTIADERDAFGFGGTQPMQVHGDDFGHRIRTGERSVDGGF